MKSSIFAYKKKYIWREVYVGIFLLVAAGFVYVSQMASDASSISSLTSFFAVYGGGSLGLYRVGHGFMRLLKSEQALIISNEGVWDASACNILIPWEAIREFKNVRPKKFGNGLVMMTDCSRLSAIPGSLTKRFSLWLAGVRVGRLGNGKLVPVMLTPPMALADTTMEDLLTAIRIHASAEIPINPSA